jgi:SWI/SNF-related matrix-associated actin-dependent regulator of chromatin subfamily A3
LCADARRRCVQVSLVGQWVAEARSKLADKSLRIVEYHGGSRPRDVQLLAAHDVVVTTYETLVSDMQGRSKALRNKEPNPLACIKWWRVVLDESHAVKGEASKQLKAVVDIQARRCARLRCRLHARLPPCRPQPPRSSQ